MPDSISTAEARKVFKYVKSRAKTDPEFREKLLSAPREVLEAEFDVPLPENFSIRFVENQGADLTVVLPDPSDPDAELSDDDLEHVAGGAGPGVDSALENVGRQRHALTRDAWVEQLS